MKLRKDDKVVVILGRDKGKSGKILAVLPKTNKIVVENLNIVKRHTKPSRSQPRGGILEVAKPIDVSKVMVLDPESDRPARIGYQIKADGSKERVFKVSRNHEAQAKKAEKAASKAAAKAKTDKKKTEASSDKPKAAGKK
jgi:large subunit ribosomal protein L24